MQEERSMIDRHKLALIALEQNIEKVTSVAQSLLLGFQAIESTHLLEKWFQDQIQSLEEMLRDSGGLDSPISDALPSDPFSALTEGNTVQELMATFNRALERLEYINGELQTWANDYSREGDRMERLRNDFQHKVLSAQGEVLEIVQQRRGAVRAEGLAPMTDEVKSRHEPGPRVVARSHPASPWAEAANLDMPPTPGKPMGRTTPVTPDALKNAASTEQVPDERATTAPDPSHDQEASSLSDDDAVHTPDMAAPKTESTQDQDDFSKRSPRVAIEVPVSVKSSTRLWFATSENCSETGIFVATPFVVPMGTRVTLELLFPGSDPIPVMGEVAWTREDNHSSSGSGMGVRLLEISDDLEQKLQQLLPEDHGSH